MRRSAEITVFLSLVLVCVSSLLMGLLESARTAGARLYLQMAADSALSSVMSQYNRALWDEYQLLFLEYESEEAVEQSFRDFFDYYLEQENLYPMRTEEITVTETVKPEENGGQALEKEILSYMQYRLPDAAAGLAGIAEEAAQAATMGDFKSLLSTCRQAGKETRGLEKRRIAVEAALRDLEEQKEKASKAAGREKEGSFRSSAKKLKQGLTRFPDRVSAYERELLRFTERQDRFFEEEGGNRFPEYEKDPAVTSCKEQERLACGEMERAAAENLKEYQKIGQTLKESEEALEEAILLLEEAEDDTEGEDVDWDGIRACLEAVQIPRPLGSREADEEKAALLDRLEELFNQDLLDLVLPDEAAVSTKKVSLKGIPSSRSCADADTGKPLEQLLVNEYIFLKFDSFLEEQKSGIPKEEKELFYEQEYLLCGRAGDRENLRETAERLLAVRGAANLSYLLSSPELRSQAEALAASVSAGNAPVQVILSLFILALWALGEAVADLQVLFAGRRVPLWKNTGTWQTSLEGLLKLDFLNREGRQDGSDTGKGYADYLRILFFLEKREVRNFRMLDVIQWNLRKKQADFAVADCAYALSVSAKVSERHLFLLKDSYSRMVSTAASY
ncbi:MAG: hypothetical protein HFE83_10840 [Lachnospiraceae bacterium]|jgi:hypothetical protein|nr:hypothetical protein [Lachnospiraceae bacterium]